MEIIFCAFSSLMIAMDPSETSSVGFVLLLLFSIF